MEAGGGFKIKIKLLVHKDRNQVVFAEADKDFVDILLSFLTFPLGTIVRLLQKQSPSTALGSMNTLYEGLNNLDVSHFYSDKHKAMLLQPTNAAEPQCLSLTFIMDDTECMEYYTCPCSYKHDHGNNSWSTSSDTICHHGYEMKHIMYLIEDNVSTEGEKKGGVFVNGKAKFMISDDLKIMPLSASNSFELLLKLGVEDLDVLEERTVGLGPEEFLSLLRLSLLSKAPLTDLFLLKLLEPEKELDLLLQKQNESSDLSRFHPETLTKPQNIKYQESNCKKMSLKVMLQKSSNKILYAESQEDFVNYLLSLLAIPLGAVVKLLDKTPSLGCISNMYTSVEQLNVDRYMVNEYLKSKLLSPKLSAQFGYRIQPLGINENFQPQNICVFAPYDSLTFGERLTFHIKGPSLNRTPLGINGFVDGPAEFMITDDLIVTPSSPTASILLLKELKIPISDIEERVVSIGEEEALRLLECSLISKSTLSSALNFILIKKPGIENEMS